MFETIGRDAIAGVARAGKLVVYLEREIPEEHPHIDWLATALRDATRAHPGETAHLHVVEVAHRSGVRQGPREAMAGLARELDGKISAAAFVVPKGGFLSSVVRSVITGILLIAGRSTPTRTFSSVDDAMAWLAEYCGELPAREVVEGALDSLRTG